MAELQLVWELEKLSAEPDLHCFVILPGLYLRLQAAVMVKQPLTS